MFKKPKLQNIATSVHAGSQTKVHPKVVLCQDPLYRQAAQHTQSLEPILFPKLRI